MSDVDEFLLLLLSCVPKCEFPQVCEYVYENVKTMFKEK